LEDYEDLAQELDFDSLREAKRILAQDDGLLKKIEIFSGKRESTNWDMLDNDQGGALKRPLSSTE